MFQRLNNMFNAFDSWAGRQQTGNLVMRFYELVFHRCGLILKKEGA